MASKSKNGGEIILTQTPRHLDASRWQDPICVFAEDYGPILGCDRVSYSEFEDAPREAVADYQTVVFVGLTDMMTPSNRTDDVWEFAFNQMETDTVSVDEYLFRSDPWRSWFHFGLIGAEYRDYTYSYLAETDYEKYFNGRTDDNPFSIAELKKWGDGVIESHYTKYFREFTVNVEYETDSSEEYEYSELVDELFQTKNTIGQVRRALEDYADELYPDRQLPTRHQLFRGEREWELRITDLPIDQWKAGYLQDLVDLTDNIAEEFYVESS